MLAGVEPLADEDPFVGFAGTSPLFIEESPGHYELNPVKASYFNAPQSFVNPKPSGVFRIVVLGGSTTYGRPYLQNTSFGAWLEKLIEQYSVNTEIEVINAGGISYASYRVRKLMQELVAYEPDLFVLYSGHNEFLEARTFANLREEQQEIRLVRRLVHHSRLYSVLARLLSSAGRVTLGEDVAATLEQIGGPELYHRDPEFRAGVIRQYEYEIGEMVRLCKARSIPLVLATLPVNLSGISPFKSQHAAQLDRDSLKRWESLFAQGEAALERGEAELALSAFAQAETIDDGYALLHYRKGQAYEQTDNLTKAYESFDRARQEDIVPLRALNEFNQALRSTATSAGVPLADVEKFYLRVSSGRVPGNNLFVDHVHPSIEGQQLIAWVVLNAATNADLLPLDASTWQQSMTEARDFLRRELDAIPERYQAKGHGGVGRLYFWAGKYPEAYVSLLHAWENIKDNPEMARQLGQLELVRGDAEQALVYLDAAERLEPGNSNVIMARAAALSLSGRAEEALELLLRSEAPKGDKAAGFNYTLGQIMMKLARPAAAVGYFDQAVSGAPMVATYRLKLAEAQKRTGRQQDAQATYRDYLALLENPETVVSPEQWLELP